ncbi:metal-dependent transcriptional regulator [Lactobacillus sp. CC-MHH1034]|uniref:metal-dependent transcriptional regulator n=1 Tax=Agrilactobacillus fermenti TaxID=2586909 RepID=UPI001E49E5E5|nr:metal-dependent transcriptional regulator [Agrilactobacillus fermenti]MCD2256803.1 metal-dependent transcriptional regulator [Agrilactobacillus fermenti]
MSPNKENYLKTIFELQYDHRKINNKNIADIMGVSAPSVSEMITALSKDGLVEHSPYNEITLTESGRETARTMVKRHRIWEVFLVDKLGYSPLEVHHAADTLEHATNEDLVDRLNRFLDYPKRCPHGSIIPDNCDEANESMVTLATLAPGQSGEVDRVIDNHEFLTYFYELKLNLGDKLTFVRQLPLGGPIEVKVNDDRLIQIGTSAATYIFVDHITDPE